MKSIPYYLIFIIPIILITGNYLGDIYNFLIPVTLFGLLPILDIIVGKSVKNPMFEQEKYSLRFKIIPILCVPVQLSIIVWALFVFSNEYMTKIEIIGFTISLGISSGILGINISHELAHRIENKLEPFLAKILLLTVGYLHWSIEHVYGHHKTVGTCDDPATAKLGDSIFSFLPKTIFGGIVSSWKIDNNLQKKPDKIRINRILIYFILQISIIILISALFSINTSLFFIAQGAISIILLEIVNYIEHYGLTRKKVDENHYESIKKYHSWDSSNIITNYMLFNIQRHSDHHFRPEQRYHVLKTYNDCPKLPTGYAGMILIALIPALWRFIIDKKVKNIEKYANAYN